MSDYECQLRTLIRQTPLVWSMLEAVRRCHPPDWYVGAGLIRSLVWDHLHGYTTPTKVSDVDVVFFDGHDPDGTVTSALLAALQQQRPDVPWEVTNQATVHHWHPGRTRPLSSALDGIGTWPETATAVGIRLLADDSLVIAAPCGLTDLFELVVRRNPRHDDVTTYRQRVGSKAFQQRWPKVRVVEG